MKRLMTSVMILTAFTTSAFATTTLNCKSANYSIVVSDIEAFSFANYGINGVMNDGADVEVGKSYISQNVIALALTVDGQKSKFELSATKIAPTKYEGKIFTGKLSQKVVCSRL